MFGSADITVPVSDVPCPGCGANMHCQVTAATPTRVLL